MPKYSIKMRVAKQGKHVSGAERIVPQELITATIGALSERALHHGLGRADFINIKMEKVRNYYLQLVKKIIKILLKILLGF